MWLRDLSKDRAGDKTFLLLLLAVEMFVVNSYVSLRYGLVKLLGMFICGLFRFYRRILMIKKNFNSALVE